MMLPRRYMRLGHITDVLQVNMRGWQTSQGVSLEDASINNLEMVRQWLATHSCQDRDQI